MGKLTRVAVAVVSMACVAACASGTDSGASSTPQTPATQTTQHEPASGATSATPSAKAAKPAYTELPFTLDGTATAVAVNGDGVYVADFGMGNELDPNNVIMHTEEGRVVLLETGANVQKDVVKVAAPLRMALGPDGSVYAFENRFEDSSSQVVKFPHGSTTPVPLHFPPRPRNVAVSETGDVVVLYDDSVQILPNGAPTAALVSIDVDRFNDALALSRDGAIYFFGGRAINEIMVIDKGAPKPRKFADSTNQILAMAVDANGDLYVLDVDQAQGTASYAVRKFTHGSTTPTDVLVTGLESPNSIAVSNGDVYIADGKRVLKLPRQ